MTFIWSSLAALVLFVGFRHRQRLNALRSTDAKPAIDDAAIQRIIDDGRLGREDDDDRLDLDAAAQAEQEFLDEYWDLPDED